MTVTLTPEQWQLFDCSLTDIDSHGITNVEAHVERLVETYSGRVEAEHLTGVTLTFKDDLHATKFALRYL